jgi:phosphate transport system ATP-binding protein
MGRCFNFDFDGVGLKPHHSFIFSKKESIMNASDQTAVLRIEQLKAYVDAFEILHGIDLEIQSNEVVAFIGPSGCGKSTMLRCLNRLHEETAGARVEGQVYLQDQNIYKSGTDPVDVRRRIGMVFQKPNPFPSMSIFENVASGLRLNGLAKGSELNDQVERALKQAALFDEVKDKLHQMGTSLSGGQQQRLCIARALAVKPPVLLMDEPTSALDPISTAKIEELVLQLKKEMTLIIVTHNMQQAARISNKTAFFLYGNLIEYGVTTDVFTTPKQKKTEEYITGRFG